MSTRLKMGEFIAMTPEQQIEHKRMLQRRWRAKHKNWVKAQNHKYYEIYKKKKPCVVVCKYCGKEFNAPRKYYKMCPDCLNAPKPTHLKEIEKAKKCAEKELFREEVRKCYASGLSQDNVAKLFGITQKTVSNWVRKQKI